MEAALSLPAATLATATESLGPRMGPYLVAFRSCLELSSTALEANLPASPMLETKLGVLDDWLDIISPTDILFHHITAICTLAGATACILAEDPSEQLAFISHELSPSISALRAMSDDSHKVFADATDNFMSQLTLFVKANCSTSASASCPQNVASASDVCSVPNHSAPHLLAYRASISDNAVSAFQAASISIGGIVAKQALSASNALNAIYDFIVEASNLSEPPSDENKQAMLDPIIKHMSAVSAVSADISPRDPLYNHVKAVEEAINMISWLVATEKPISVISDAQGAASFYTSRILVATKKKDDADSHKSFVNCLNSIFDAMKAYVKEFFTMGLRYGIGVEDRATPTPAPPTSLHSEEPDVVDDINYVTAFQQIITGPLAAFIDASKVIGAEVEEQAVAFADTWQAEAQFLSKAICTPKPDDIQPLIAPIAEKMGQVVAVVEKVDPRGPLAHHCNVLGESVSAMGWVVVEEKATSYVADMAAAGQFFLDKVKMGAKKTSNPDAHGTWAKAFEALFAALKAYVKEYHTQKLVWNPPKKASSAIRSQVGAAKTDDSCVENYVTAFKQLLDGPLSSFVKASNAIGGDLQKQATSLAGAFEAESDFIEKAFNMPAPSDITPLLSPIASKMGEVAVIAESVDPRGPLGNHCKALGESVAALGWVAVEEKATAFVGDMAGAGQFFLDKVKMGAKKTTTPDIHRAWATALETLYKELKAYVKEYHTQKLVWNPAKVFRTSPGSDTIDVKDNVTKDCDYVSAYKQLLSGPLVAYVAASKTLGGEVEEQAVAFAGAWEAEGKFLEKAISMEKPSDIQDMLSPIASKMEEVGVVAEKVDPRGPLGPHCIAVKESIAALGWVAVEGKARAFVDEMVGAGQFFLDKVKVGARKASNAEAHKTWAKALETLFGDLKAYVKEHHPQKLMWNSGKKGDLHLTG